MDNLTFSKIKESIEKYTNVGIAVSANPSMDQMASALALSLSLQAIGKNVSVATPNNPLVEVSSLVGIDQVKTTLGTEAGDLIVSFPYKEGEIEKVSYTRDDKYLNIVVKAGELGLNFDEKDIRYTRGGGSIELLFVIGTPRVSDLGALYDPAGLKDTVVINIDNSADNQGYGDVIMVSPQFSSLSEAIANLLLTLNLKIDIDIAQNLITGISNATENFQSPSTSSLAFEMAGILLRSGATRPVMQKSTTNIQQRARISRVQPQPSTDSFIKQQEERVRMEEVEKKEGPKIQPPFQTSQSDLNNPPEDWLEPKIYKGSTSF